jgi:5'-nucleotidase
MNRRLILTVAACAAIATAAAAGWAKFGPLLANRAASGPATAPATAPADQRATVTLLHFNDTHGQLLGSDGKGGYARLATAIEQVRKSRPAGSVLVFHCGDEYSRADALTRRTKGRANRALINHVGIDIWTPGNGDFYDGLAEFRLRMSQTRCTTLTSNLRVGSEPLGQDTCVLTAGPVKVGVFGLCTLRLGGAGMRGVLTEDPAATAKRLAAELRKQADVVVAATHIGFTDDKHLAGDVDGIDVILGAHSHTLLTEGYRVERGGGASTLIAQAGEHLGFLGVVTLEMERTGDGSWRVASSKAQVIPLDSAIPEDPAAKAIIARISEPASQAASQQASPAGAR